MRLVGKVVLSVDTTCMVSWNRSIEYMDAQFQCVCVAGGKGGGGGGSGVCLRSSVIWMM